MTRGSVVVFNKSAASLLLLFCLARTCEAQSATPIVVPAQTANDQVAVAVGQYNINTRQDYAALATMAYLNSACSSNRGTSVCPDFNDEAAAATFLRDTYNVFSGHQPPSTVIAGLTKEEIIKFTVDQGVKALAVKFPQTAPYGAFAVAGLDLYQKGAARALDQRNQTKALFQSYDNFTKGTDSDYTVGTLSSFIQNVRSSPTLKKGAEIVFGQSVFSGQIDDGAQKRIQNTPGFATAQGVQELLTHFGPNGDFTALLGETRDIVSTNFAAVLSDLADVKGTLSTIVQDQQSILGYLANTQLQQARQAQAEQELQIKQLRMEAASSSVYLLSSFIGFVDPRLGHDVSVAGNAAINIVSSIAKFNDFASRLTSGSSNPLLNEATSLGSLVLAGNMFGSAMQIVSLFSDSGPSPDQQILEQLKQISQQIIDLHRDMDARFDQVDQSLRNIQVNLSAIYNGLTAQLTTIANGIGHLNDKVDVVQSTLSSLQSDISRLEHEIHSNELDIYRQPLLIAMDNGLSYKERTGVDLLFSGDAPNDYVSLESTFFTWSTQLSAQGIDAPLPMPNDPKFNDDQLADTFSLDALALNVNYLNILPSVKLRAAGQTSFLPPLLPGVQLPNIEDWARSAQAYVDLAREWPSHDRAFPSAVTRLTQVASAGRNLQAAIKAVTVNTDGSPNTALLSALQQFYLNKINGFATALDGYERQFEPVPGATGFDLWAGGDQQTIPPHVPTLPPQGMMSHRIPDWDYIHALSPPTGYSRFVPNAALNADRLNVNTLKLTWEPQTTDTYFQLDSDGAMHKHSWITITAGFPVPNSDGGLFPIFFRTIRGPDVCIFGHCGGDQLYYNSIKAAWETGLRDLFASQSVEGLGQDLFSHIADPTLKQELQDYQTQVLGECAQNTARFQAWVEGALRAQQSRFYSNVITDLTSKPALAKPVKELAGASAVVGAFATFGLQRSLDSNEVLRALLFGDERLPDATLLTQLFSVAASASNDPKSVVAILASRPAPALAEAYAIFGQISAGSRIESSRAVDNVLHSIDAHTAVRSLVLATDERNAVQITKGGFRYRHGTKTFTQSVSVKNVGSVAIDGPLTLVVDLLASGNGQRDTVLTNSTGLTVVAAPLASPYVTIDLGTGSSLLPNASAVVVLSFSNPSNSGIVYSARVLAGRGFR